MITFAVHVFLLAGRLLKSGASNLEARPPTPRKLQISIPKMAVSRSHLLSLASIRFTSRWPLFLVGYSHRSHLCQLSAFDCSPSFFLFYAVHFSSHAFVPVCGVPDLRGRRTVTHPLPASFFLDVVRSRYARSCVCYPALPVLAHQPALILQLLPGSDIFQRSPVNERSAGTSPTQSLF